MFKNFFKYVVTFEKNAVPTSIRNSVEAARAIIGIIIIFVTASIFKPINKRLAAYSSCIELIGMAIWCSR